MTDRTMKLVVGYVPRVDRLPSELRRGGFTRRVAFVLDTFRSGNVDMYFDDGLYTALVGAMQDVVSADRMSAVLSSGKTIDLVDTAGLMRLLAQEPTAERGPLPRVLMARGDRTVCVIESEAWAETGGPEPYHDSYTIPVYSQYDLSKPIEAAVRAVCRQTGAELTSVVRGSETPVRPSILSRIKDRLRFR
jgi:hypothetical protein